MENWVPEWGDCLVEWEELWVCSEDPEETTFKEQLEDEEEKLETVEVWKPWEEYTKDLWLSVSSVTDSLRVQTRQL